MFGKNNKSNNSEDKKTNNDSNRNSEKKEETDMVSNPSREVLVKSKTLTIEKIVVVFKKIKPKVGPEREQFNIYQFDDNGECKMLERDAILFWKQRKNIKGLENDISVFSIKNEEDGDEDSITEEIEYSFDDVKNLYKVEKVDISDSEQRKDEDEDKK